MTKIQSQSSKSAKSASLTDRERDTNAHALGAVRSELLAIPCDEVSVPVESAFVFASEARALVQTASAAASAEEAALLGRVELLARALEHAQYEWTWQPPTKVVEDADGLVADAERVFHSVEELFGQQVRRGVIRRRFVPPRQRSGLDDRCQRIERLVDVLQQHRRFEPRALLHSARRLASIVPFAEPATPGAISPTELRNRAYTALLCALAALKSQRGTTEGSGVFVIGDHEISLVHATR